MLVELGQLSGREHTSVGIGSFVSLGGWEDGSGCWCQVRSPPRAVARIPSHLGLLWGLGRSARDVAISAYTGQGDISCQNSYRDAEPAARSLAWWSVALGCAGGWCVHGCVLLSWPRGGAVAADRMGANRAQCGTSRLFPMRCEMEEMPGAACGVSAAHVAQDRSLRGHQVNADRVLRWAVPRCLPAVCARRARRRPQGSGAGRWA